MPGIVEICVESAEGAGSARNGRAGRVEICANRRVGGVTPDAGEIRQACRLVRIPVHVLIRPREGDFVYTSDESDRMATEIEMAKTLGASGVVFGMLQPDGSINREQTTKLVTLARPLSVTFHKAFDLTTNPLDALEFLIALGIERVLTSGHAARASEGVAPLASLVRQAAGRITIMAGGSLTLDDLPAMADAGLTEIHAGSCVEREGRTCEDLVKRLVSTWEVCVRARLQHNPGVLNA